MDANGKEKTDVKPVKTIAYDIANDPDVINAAKAYTEAYNVHVTNRTSVRNAVRNHLETDMPLFTRILNGTSTPADITRLETLLASAKGNSMKKAS